MSFEVGDIVYLQLPDSLYTQYFGNKIYGFVYSIRQDGDILIRWFKSQNNFWYDPTTEGLSKAWMFLLVLLLWAFIQIKTHMDAIFLGIIFGFLMESLFHCPFLIMIRSGGLSMDYNKIKIGDIITYIPAKLIGIISKVEGHLVFIHWLNHNVITFHEVAIFPIKHIQNDKWDILWLEQ